MPLKQDLVQSCGPKYGARFFALPLQIQNATQKRFSVDTTKITICRTVCSQKYTLGQILFCLEIL